MSPPTEIERQEAQRLIPVGRTGTPEDLVGLAMSLLSDETAAYVTGVSIPVDGGLGLHSWHDDLP